MLIQSFISTVVHDLTFAMSGTKTEKKIFYLIGHTRNKTCFVLKYTYILYVSKSLFCFGFFVIVCVFISFIVTSTTYINSVLLDDILFCNYLVVNIHIIINHRRQISFNLSNIMSISILLLLSSSS